MKIFPDVDFSSSSHDMTLQSPRKKRDFYGKSSTPTPFNHRLSRPINRTDVAFSPKTRPSSTPACLASLPRIPIPDRPISIPPLKTSN